MFFKKLKLKAYGVCVQHIALLDSWRTDFKI